MLDAAVWEDVRQLLSEPERVRAEYERRLQGPETGPSREVEHIDKLISNVKKMISRLIDAYGDGLLDKSEFEPTDLGGERAAGQDWRTSVGSGSARPPRRRNCGW